MGSEGERDAQCTMALLDSNATEQPPGSHSQLLLLLLSSHRQGTMTATTPLGQRRTEPPCHTPHCRGVNGLKWRRVARGHACSSTTAGMHRDHPCIGRAANLDSVLANLTVHGSC